MEPSHAQSHVTDESSIQVQESGVSDIGSDGYDLSDSEKEPDPSPKMDSDLEVISDEEIYDGDCLDDKYALGQSHPDSPATDESSISEEEWWEYMIEMGLEFESRQNVAEVNQNPIPQVHQPPANELDIGLEDLIAWIFESNIFSLCYAIWLCLKVTGLVSCLPTPGNDK
ncbi:unnamed protein product [Mesocestoides corti]|uniref:Uncharacterized protein n=2 Tax=Mesocestoides corti TaxID=53468 RepID=A0A0R3UD67_MESCO|nr:unnamed protein product [Mesocestoides corti]